MLSKSKISQIVLSATSLCLAACTTSSYNRTVPQVDLDRFMGKWYVIAGRFTMFEDGAYNATETYTFNQAEDRIEVDYRHNHDAPDGPVKEIPQTAWVHNKETNAHWLVRPWWPFKFDYLIIGLGQDYEWTAVGVPSQSYLWIMARQPDFPKSKVEEILKDLQSTGYNTKDIVFVPQREQ